MKGTFDKSAKLRPFKVGDTVLLWDKRREKSSKHGKFDSLWRGPFIICDLSEMNSFILNTMEGERLPLPMNGQHLKLLYDSNLQKMTLGSIQGFSKPSLGVFLCTSILYHIVVPYMLVY